jgi:type III restriction enzyme
MINELFPFQRQAVNDLRFRTAMALNNYRMLRVPQVVSLQAPTGSGKTIIMSALIEDIYFGSDNFTEQPEAIFVWLSDSPQLNEQSKQKIELKADKIRLDQCVVISDESFDKEVLEDGHIYFLNTQKLGKAGNLSHHSDTRQYTIWETIENTTKQKADRLYFIIDEAHRGMQGRAAGTATTIMQRFIKGSQPHKLSPVPVVIGMSATAARFNALVGDTSSTLQKVVVSPAQVRASGLLKDRIVITYPEDPTKHSDMAVLQAATDEWMDKCRHWYQYTYEQHYSNVNPVFVIQVTAGSGKKVSDTDLDDVIAKIEDRSGEQFKEGEVVHTFGSIGTLQINGLAVPHEEPSEIADNRKIKVVLFKENLSTGWDCPRAETMMSFRKAEDATYIAQLLGRMVRTPLQCHVLVDDSLNDVRLFLPYFNKETVQDVINELQNAEGGEIPTVIDGESLEEQVYVPWTVHTRKPKQPAQVEGQLGLFENGFLNAGSAVTDVPAETAPVQNSGVTYASESSITEKPALGIPETKLEMHEKEHSYCPTEEVHPQETPLPVVEIPATPEKPNTGTESADNYEQMTLIPELDREAVIKFINEQGYLTYVVRSVKINSYLKSLLSLAGLLTQNMIYLDAVDEVKKEVTDLIRAYITRLHKENKYDALVKQVMEFKLSIQIFDVFGEAISNYYISDLFATAESDLDRQLRAADAKMCGGGFTYAYGRRFLDVDDPDAFKIDCILFAADDDCIAQLNKYAESKFHALNDKYRKYVVSRSEKCRKQYSDIIADGDVISKHNFTLPETISAKVEKGGQKYYNHLFAPEDGAAIIKLNSWEDGVLQEEQKRDDFVCWLRNPSRQSWSLRIPYEIDGETKETFPDFIIIRRDAELGYVIDILEPHNPEFKDNLGKAKGFALYAEAEPRIGRIQLIRMGKDAASNNRFKRLDMAKGAVRNKVLAAINNDELDHIFDTYGEFQN